HLQHADATETARILTDLFPETSTQTGQFAPRFGGGMRGGPGGMPGMPGGAGATMTDQSQRQLQQTTVRAVADPRTNSVIVYAASTTMEQIRRMIAQLDSRTDKKQKVFVYRLDYADVENVSEILRNMFENNLYGTSSRTTRSTTAGGTATGSTLSNRNMQQSSFQLNTQNSNR
ncbi:MAG TPA: secretin N-terminal domain-containing protein, partial [bacterium]|nr:secretin N-terminal domain-containing protein [bacterium]